jgi:ferrous iron transport protein A
MKNRIQNAFNPTCEQACEDCHGICLSDVGCGVCVRIRHLHGDDGLCKRLREMGLCEKTQLEKISDNGALICRIRDNHIILSEAIAKSIFVELLDTAVS